MSTEYKSKHLSRDEMTRLVKNHLANGEREHADKHLKECSLCSEAFDGLKQLPDLTPLHTLNAKWKIKTGIKTSLKTLEINLPALYTVLTLAGLLALVIIYFFFFNTPANKSQAITKVVSNTHGNENQKPQEHFIIEEKIIPANEGATEHDKIPQPEVAEGTYDKLKKPGTALEKLEPVTLQKEIPVNTLMIVKGYSKQNLLNIEGFKIIDYSEEYRQEENSLKSFSEGVSARYESEKEMQQSQRDEMLSTSIVNYEEVIAGGLRNYKNGKWMDALSSFNFMLDYFPGDLNCRFYRALCYEGSGQYEKAIDELKPLSSRNTHTFYEEAKWHLALCCEQNGDKSTSQRLFTEITNEGGFYKTQALQRK